MPSVSPRAVLDPDRQLDSPFVTTASRAPVGGLFASLVDDAGLFPPAGLSMQAALERHREDLADTTGMLSHRFVCPADRLEELTAGLDYELAVSLITPLSPGSVAGVLEQVGQDDPLVLAGLEGLPAGEIEGIDAPVPVFVEVSVKTGVEAALDELVSAGLSAKVRCGGLKEELFPTRAELAGFIAAAARRAVSFKATAGLHHALCYTDEETGFSHHGFLNLLLASCRAADGAERRALEDALGLSQPDVVVGELESVGSELGRRARELFVSYGSCSTSEPVEDLVGLGLLGAGAGRR